MTDHDLQTAIRRELGVSEPPYPVDLPALRRAGRRRQTLRAVGAGAAAVTAAAVAIAVVAISNGPQREAVDVADPTATVAPTAPPTNASPSEPGLTEVAPPPRRPLTVAPADFPKTFATFFPGEITTLAQKEPDTPIVDFRWNGYAARVGFFEAERALGNRVSDGRPDYAEDDYAAAGTPMERCAEYATKAAPCRRIADGSVAQLIHRTSVPGPGGPTTNFAKAYTRDGWDIVVTLSNYADKDGATVLAPDPPLTTEQLLGVARSDVWFS